MKKFLIAFAVAAIAVAGSFAQDAVADAMAAAEAAREEVPQSLQGTWYDKKYDCNWVFSLNTTEKALCKLVDASTGHVYYKFTKDNVQNFQQKHDVTSGVTISFECAAKNRKYVFNKSISIMCPRSDFFLHSHAAKGGAASCSPSSRFAKRSTRDRMPTGIRSGHCCVTHYTLHARSWARLSPWTPLRLKKTKARDDAHTHAY